MTCETCNGTGMDPERTEDSCGRLASSSWCPTCGGTGSVPRPHDEREDLPGEEYDR